MGTITLCPWRVLVAIAISCVWFAVAGPVASAQQEKSCLCRNVSANSSPSDPTDVCTRTETPSNCNLRWNATSPPPRPGKNVRGPSDLTFHRSFVQGVAALAKSGVAPPPSGVAACAGSPDPACPWIEFLRLDSYTEDPPSAAVAFVGLAAAAFVAADDQARGSALAQELRNETQRREIGDALAGKLPVATRGTDLYSLRATPGCLRVQTPSRSIVIAVQNRASRNQDSCRE